MNPPLSKAGPYDILDVLHRGPRSVIYLATNADTEQQVVVKVATEPPGADDGRTTSHLIHRHIVRVLDSGEDQGLAYVVMERLQGRTLFEMMADATVTADLPTRVDLVAQLCVGLHHAHEQQIVHGNLRPDSIFVTDDGVTKILGFEASARANDHTVVSDNAIAGSFEYMSPEQIIGREAIDGRSDIFSAGVILYELVAGRRPFQGGSTPTTLARILRDDPPPIEGFDRLNAILRRALEKDPAKRYASAQEFAYALWMMDIPVAVVEEDDADVAGAETLIAGAADDAAPDEAEELPAAMRLASPQTLVYAAIATAVVVVSAAIIASC